MIPEPERHIPVLEIGGTHVTAAWIDARGWTVDFRHRQSLDAAGDAQALLAQFALAGSRLSGTAGAHWGVAVPGPFDYAAGIAHYRGVGKFDSLDGVDVGQALMRSLPERPSSVTFLNDASAFLFGEWLDGAAKGADRCIGLTLGTGVGSAFLAGGKIVDKSDDVPPDAEVHLLRHAGIPLEEWVSRRAIRREFGADLDVEAIAELARAGDDRAKAVFAKAFTILGEVLRPWLRRFQPEVLVIGGSVSQAWDLIESPLRAGLSGTDGLLRPLLRPSLDFDRSALVGAAYAVFRQQVEQASGR